jgi:NhaP-type Na+/H+ or K+/H+ antiporter
LADFGTIPLELLAGVGVGAVFGFLLFVATQPKKADGETPALDKMRMYMLVGLASVSLLGLKAINYTGCAALSTVVLAIGAAKGWGPAASKRVSAPLTQIWNTVAQPLLFGLVGAEVDFGDMDPHVVGIGLAMLACSLAARFLMASASMSGRGLNGKEKLFTALSQLPKATVQAALCAVALDKAREQPLDDDTRAKEILLGKDVLHLAVLIILCTAPVGATIIYATGPRLLQKDGVDHFASSHRSMVPELEEPTPDVVSQLLSQCDSAAEGLSKSLNTVDGASTAAPSTAIRPSWPSTAGRPSNVSAV